DGPIQCIDIQPPSPIRGVVASLAIFRQERGYLGWWSRIKGDGKNKMQHRGQQHYPGQDIGWTLQNSHQLFLQDSVLLGALCSATSIACYGI
ncbi:MAG: hypothetical protein WCP62_14665, partial [Planctomycetota bacterium]